MEVVPNPEQIPSPEEQIAEQQAPDVTSSETPAADVAAAIAQSKQADHRPAYANQLKKIFMKTLEDKRQPVAMYIHMHYVDGSFERHHTIHPEFNLMQSIGAFECEKSDAVKKVIGDK